MRTDSYAAAFVRIYDGSLVSVSEQIHRQRTNITAPRYRLRRLLTRRRGLLIRPRRLLIKLSQVDVNLLRTIGKALANTDHYDSPSQRRFRYES